jgi:Fic family protein
MKKSKKDIILKLFEENSDGLTIQEIANLGKMSRITATIYIHEILGEGVITERKIGAYRLFYPKEKYLESVKQKELIEKLKDKIG